MAALQAGQEAGQEVGLTLLGVAQLQAQRDSRENSLLHFILYKNYSQQNTEEGHATCCQKHWAQGQPRLRRSELCKQPMTARLVCAAQEVQGEEPVPGGAAGGGCAGRGGGGTVTTTGGGGIKIGGGGDMANGGGLDGSGGGEVGVAVGTGAGGGPALPQLIA